MTATHAETKMTASEPSPNSVPKPSNQSPEKEKIDMNNSTFTPGTRVRDAWNDSLGTVAQDQSKAAEYPGTVEIQWDHGGSTCASPKMLAPVGGPTESGDVEFPIGSTVVLDHEACPFNDVIGTGTVVPMPPEADAHPGLVAVRWHDQKHSPGISAGYDPVFLKPVMTFEQWSGKGYAEVSTPAPAGIEKFTEAEIRAELDRRREVMRLEVEAAAHAWQVRQMTEWLAKPIGHHASKCEWTHRVICAIQIVREQVPAYSINRLAMVAEIPVSTLKDRLNGKGILTVTDVLKLAWAMGVKVTDFFQLANKGEIK